jgi:hypothetical protein
MPKRKDQVEEWVGMPEFNQPDKSPYQKIVVNFECEEDVEKFANLTGYKLTSKSRSIWFPYRNRVNRKAVEYVNAD